MSGGGPSEEAWVDLPPHLEEPLIVYVSEIAERLPPRHTKVPSSR